MPVTSPTLHMLCGKIASGKSTLAEALGRRERTVLIAEDDWLGRLYSDQMDTPRDFVRCAAKLQSIMGPHVVALLRAGVSVVLDFQANTLESRAWMRGVLDQTGAEHQLHVFDVPDAVCINRLRARNAEGTHAFAATEAQYWQVSKYFVLPTPEEGFEVVMHGEDG